MIRNSESQLDAFLEGERRRRLASCRPLKYPRASLRRAMDLVGAEGRRGGTRGGRSDFKWDSVRPQEREFYLGNSVAQPAGGVGKRAGTRSFNWFATPAANENPHAARDAAAKDLARVRRTEKRAMELALAGTSFSEAVRSALAESGDSGVDDEAGRGDSASGEARRASRSTAEKAEKAQRKEARRRTRELRRVRRAERQKDRENNQEVAQAHRHDSSESERESLRSRFHDEPCRRRRRRERESATRRKRSDWASSSDLDDAGKHCHRRPRLR